MSTSRDPRSSIERVIGKAILPQTYNVRNDLFEVLIFSLVVEAASLEGASIAYKTGDGGKAVAPYRFRRGPGRIAGPLGIQYVHAELTFAAHDTLEVHQGIYIAEVSQLKHECDVAVIKKAECDRSRANSTHPRSNQVQLAIECKYFSSDVGISIARSFAGLERDLNAKRHAIWLATNSNVRLIKRYLTRHQLEYKDFVTPASDRLKNLKEQFREMFERYQS